MNISLILLSKLIVSHLVTDFIIQPSSWILNRNRKHFASPYLYLHGLITAGLAWLLIGWEYWQVAVILFVTHILIDGWKSYQKQILSYFLIDQGLHLLVILTTWFFMFANGKMLISEASQIPAPRFWILLTAFVFVTAPAGILIGQWTKKWRDKLVDGVGLAEAGKWIGIIERIIILILIIKNQYDAIGFLVAAKSILRFNENRRPEIKTEYLLIGTLISFAIALITGITALALLRYIR